MAAGIRALSGLNKRLGFPNQAEIDSDYLPDWGSAEMSKALSVDLRIRVLAAVAAGASHRQVAERFGVSPASVARWKALEREQGAPPKGLGGDRRSGRIDAHRDAVMAALGPQKDATIEEIRSALAAQGLFFGFGDLAPEFYPL